MLEGIDICSYCHRPITSDCRECRSDRNAKDCCSGAPLGGAGACRIGPEHPGAQWIRDAKEDEGKARLAEMLEGFAPALLAVAEVSQYGYLKHTLPARRKLIREEGATPEEAEAAIGYNNWWNGTLKTYENAQVRHMLARMAGEKFAPDSGLRHRAHEVWNALAALTLELLAEQKDAGRAGAADQSSRSSSSSSSSSSPR